MLKFGNLLPEFASRSVSELPRPRLRQLTYKLVLAQQAEQEMLCFDESGTQLTHFVAREKDRPPGTVGIPLKHAEPLASV
jgi:hypothetical protein